ncbi:SMI1/KNR4 family protein [Streptomyces termitum]|uniref:SMI1/KNR4 family protein n=1 Tax=Streptomyces termitum TaxID=67368 RepID=UPI003795BF6E
MSETSGEDQDLPEALAAVARAGFDYDDGRGIDFEPYDAFESAEETTDWIRSWTGNEELDGDAFRVFGQDGSGGLAALWCVREGRPLDAQPVVFLGSEGERGVIAGSLSDFLWVLADGVGPMEVVLFGALEGEGRANAGLTALAERYATTPRRPAREIVAEAAAEFPDFSDAVDALCR